MPGQVRLRRRQARTRNADMQAWFQPGSGSHASPGPLTTSSTSSTSSTGARSSRVQCAKGAGARDIQDAAGREGPGKLLGCRDCHAHLQPLSPCGKPRGLVWMTPVSPARSAPLTRTHLSTPNTCRTCRTG